MAWNTSRISDQQNKLVLVTGANSGIGLETARELAGKGATVVMACRNLEKAEISAKDIMRSHVKARLDIRELDLTSLASVRAFAEKFKSDYHKLDILINNAGVMVPPFSTTEDGFELQFACNHLGHFALTGLLIELLLSSVNSRVVTVSSVAHRLGKIDFDNLRGEKKYRASPAYCRSKLANMIFSRELQRRLSASGSEVKSLAAHPGATQTNLARHSMSRLGTLMDMMAQPTANGAWPSLRAATDSNAVGGELYGPDGFLALRGLPVKERASRRAYDENLALRLWEESEQMTGVSFL